MALIKCNECGNMISDRATKCPKCGCPITKGSKPHIHQETPQVQPSYYDDKNGGSSSKWLYGIVGVLVALLVGLGLWMWNSGAFDSHRTDQISTDSVDVAKAENLDGTHLFRGEIGPYGAEMSITISGSEVSGLYHYDFQKAGVNMSLNGTLKEDGTLIVNEHTPNGKNTGCFDGTFDGKTYRGTFRNLTNGEQYSFNFLPTDALTSLSTEENTDVNMDDDNEVNEMSRKGYTTRSFSVGYVTYNEGDEVSYKQISKDKVQLWAVSEWGKIVPASYVRFSGFYVGTITDPVDNYVNVRKGPGTNYPIVQTVNVGDHFWFQKTNSNWVKLYEVDEFLGYIYFNRIDASTPVP